MDLTASSLHTRQSFVGVDGITLTVAQASYGKVDVADVIAGVAAPVEAIATSDGRHADLSGWHEGQSSDQIFFERYDARGRVSHGWIDRTSRRLVQAG